MLKFLVFLLVIAIFFVGFLWFGKMTEIEPLPTSQTSATTTDLRFGIADGSLSYLGQADLMARLRSIKNLGVTWVRFDVDWSAIQREGPDNYNWSGYDRVAAALNTLGLRGLGIIDYTPQWALPANCLQSNKCAPADPAQFAAFAATVAQRYAPQGMHTWEIWNEPNLEEFWQPMPNVILYANLLKDTYAAIKKQDPSAIVILGGLSRAGTGNGNLSPIDFLTQLYADGAKGYFDAVGFHPYSYPVMPSSFYAWNAWLQIASTTPSLRSIMMTNGDAGKQIWITEYGAPTGGPGALATSNNYNPSQNPDHVTEAYQAQMFTDAIASVKKMPLVGALFFYTYKDSGTSQSTIENFFGLVRYDGSTKPAYDTLKSLLL